MIATRHSYTPVKKGMKIAGTRIIPLVIEKEKMEEAEKKAGPAPIMEVVPYQLKTAGLITTGNEVRDHQGYIFGSGHRKIKTIWY